MKKYETPEIEIMTIAVEDIITTSSTTILPDQDL